MQTQINKLDAFVERLNTATGTHPDYSFIKKFVNAARKSAKCRTDDDILEQVMAYIVNQDIIRQQKQISQHVTIIYDNIAKLASYPNWAILGFIAANALETEIAILETKAAENDKELIKLLKLKLTLLKADTDTFYALLAAVAEANYKINYTSVI